MKRCVNNRKNVGACSEFSGGYMPCPSGGGVTRKERKPIKYYILVGLTLRCRPVDTVFDRGAYSTEMFFRIFSVHVMLVLYEVQLCEQRAIF